MGARLFLQLVCRRLAAGKSQLWRREVEEVVSKLIKSAIPASSCNPESIQLSGATNCSSTCSSEVLPPYSNHLVALIEM